MASRGAQLQRTKEVPAASRGPPRSSEAGRHARRLRPPTWPARFESEGYARIRRRDAFLGRGFDSHRLHQVVVPTWAPGATGCNQGGSRYSKPEFSLSHPTEHQSLHFRFQRDPPSCEQGSGDKPRHVCRFPACLAFEARLRYSLFEPAKLPFVGRAVQNALVERELRARSVTSSNQRDVLHFPMT